MNKWYQIYVTASNKESEQAMMNRADDLLTTRFSAAFVAPDGAPKRNADGNYEVRVFDPRILPMIKGILVQHCGFEIVNVIERE